MTVGLFIVAFAFLWAGATLLIGEWLERHRRRLSLADRLRPYIPTVADEAEVWLSIVGRRREEPN